MRKTVNRTHIEGYLYEHNLQMRETGPQSKNPGTQYISGSISIATDEELTNIIPVYFTYVTAMTARGKENASFTILTNILDGVLKNVMDSSKEEAAKLRIDSSIGLNEFYSDRSGTEELVSTKRNDGGFMHTTATLNADEKQRATFETDIILMKAIFKEADPERDRPDQVILSGFIFNFRKEIMPVSYVVKNQAAMQYFLDLGITESKPVFTKLKGLQISTTTVRRVEEENAWGEISVVEVPSSQREFLVNYAAKEPFEWDDAESGISVLEFQDCLAQRQTTLATIKQRQDDYKKNAQNKSNAFATSATPAAATSAYKFM